MIPVDQTVFGAPHGNCLSACIASLLHLSIEDVPHFGDGDWFDNLRRWLSARGFYPVCAKLEGGADAWRPDGLYILAGPSPRGDFLHAVVARGRAVIHDPHPSRAGVLAHADATVLIPFDPASATGGGR